MTRTSLLVLLALVQVGCARHGDQPPSQLPDAAARLTFVDGAHQTTVDKRTLAQGALELVTQYDPYYRAQKRFWAVPLAPLLTRHLSADVPGTQLVLRARDGYAVPIEASRLTDGTAYLALADADFVDAGGWEPIGPRRADPAPFYVVWKGPDRVDLERFPRPWALDRIERASFATLYAHTVPVGAPADSPAGRGWEIFGQQCVRCHAINREGGRVGPELNVPRSIVEYWPAAQIKEYIRDPQRFRYGNMPAHPQLTDGDLDSLVAYFVVMKEHKHDPDASAR